MNVDVNVRIQVLKLRSCDLCTVLANFLFGEVELKRASVTDYKHIQKEDMQTWPERSLTAIGLRSCKVNDLTPASARFLAGCGTNEINAFKHTKKSTRRSAHLFQRQAPCSPPTGCCRPACAASHRGQARTADGCKGFRRYQSAWIAPWDDLSRPCCKLSKITDLLPKNFDHKVKHSLMSLPVAS